MNSPSRSPGWPHLLSAAVGILLIALAWWQVLGATRGLAITNLTEEGVPLRFVAPEGGQDLPGVVIAHGFSGSRQLMLAYAYTLAREGYGVMLLDFDGHGANGTPPDREGGSLQADLAVAAAALAAQPAVDASRLSLLGHSMGSGVVMSAAVDDPEAYQATVAVSPTGADVTPDRPRNIQFQAGTLEAPFLRNAEGLLAAAGGANSDFAGGRARALVVVPNVEHITILFSRTSHQAALDWLNASLARPAATVSADTRMIWYGLHLVGWLLLAASIRPLLPAAPTPPAQVRRRPWFWAGMIAAALAASGLLAVLGRVINVGGLGGMLIAGPIALWFLIFGTVWLVAGFRPPRPTPGDLAWGLALFALLWLAFGLMGQIVWLNWLLIPERLIRWPFLAAAALPWLLATGLLIERSGVGGRAGWWLAQSAVIAAGLGLAVVLVPGLSFVILILPVLPILLGIMLVAGSLVGRPWSFAIGNALFFGWTLAAVFPLV
jgi:pimeloyl-ACP methyl ester carboxylesterase